MGDLSLTIPNLTAAQIATIAAFAEKVTMDGRINNVANYIHEAQSVPVGNAPAIVPAVVHGISPAPAIASTADTGNAADAASGGAPAGAIATDSRGVPYRADFHASNAGKNKDGSWRRKKGVDKTAADAFEAQFVGKQPNPYDPGPVPSTASNAMPSPSVPVAGVSANIPPLPVAAPAPGTPGMQEVEALWNKLVQTGQVGADHLAYIVAMWPGAHPTAAPGNKVLMDNPATRVAVYEFIKQYDV